MFLSDSLISFTALWRQIRNGKISTFIVSESNHCDGWWCQRATPHGQHIGTLSHCNNAHLHSHFSLCFASTFHSHIGGLKICLILSKEIWAKFSTNAILSGSFSIFLVRLLIKYSCCCFGCSHTYFVGRNVRSESRYSMYSIYGDYCN